MAFCNNRTAARIAYYAYVDSLYVVMAKPSAYGCPVSCTQSVFDIHVKYYHENAFIQVDDEVTFLNPHLQLNEAIKNEKILFTRFGFVGKSLVLLIAKN